MERHPGRASEGIAAPWTVSGPDFEPTNGALCLVLMDELPWASKAWFVELDANGIVFEVAPSDVMGEIPLGQYTVVLIANDQPQQRYDRYNENLGWFEDYVFAGGVLFVGAACPVPRLVGRAASRHPVATVEPAAGVVPLGEVQAIAAAVNATRLETGFYGGELIVLTTDLPAETLSAPLVSAHITRRQVVGLRSGFRAPRTPPQIGPWAETDPPRRER